MLTPLMEFLHLFFAFSYVGSMVVAEWNGRAARATDDWGQRAVLYENIWLSSRAIGFASLIMVGIFGNLGAHRLGYSMASDRWFQAVNGLWLLSVAGMLVLTLPHAGKLAKLSKLAAGGGEATGFASASARWRFGNVVQSLLYLTMLVLMVWHWKS